MKIEITKRTLGYHPSYKEWVPCIMVGNKKYAKKYDWRVGDKLIIKECPKGLYISKDENQT